MRKPHAAAFAGGLLALLLLAYVAALAGRVAPAEEMRTNNFGGAGTSALATLLVRRGYSVRVERSTRFIAAANEVVLSFYPYDEEGSAADAARSAALRLRSNVVLFFRGSEANDAKTPSLSAVLSGGGGDRVSAKSPYINGALDLVVASGAAPRVPSPAATLLTENEDGDPIAVASPAPGRVIALAHGEIALNSRLGAARNADAVLGLIAAADRGGERRVTFWEGNDGNGLLDALGPWAHGVRNQLVVAFLAVAVALGGRFGLTPLRRARQRGAAETSDALANLLLRWRGPSVGIAAAVESARRRLVAARRLPANAPREAWPKHLSEPLIERVADLEDAGEGARSRDLLPLIRALDAAVEEETAGAGVYRRG